MPHGAVVGGSLGVDEIFIGEEEGSRSWNIRLNAGFLGLFWPMIHEIVYQSLHVSVALEFA